MTRRIKHNPEFQRLLISTGSLTVLFLILFHTSLISAQNGMTSDSVNIVKSSADTTRKIFGGKITNYGFGGLVIKFSRVNNQFAFMTGGRGACTINNRYTLGGGGYGVANLIRLSDSDTDTARYFKMGYGGIELGYIFFSGKKVNIGSNLLIGGGAAFWQNRPKSDNEKLFGNGFRIFPVFEPSLYGELTLNRFMRLHTGISYRYIRSADLGYINDRFLRGFSGFVGVLFGKS